jgi:hypothetical protein
MYSTRYSNRRRIYNVSKSLDSLCDANVCVVSFNDITPSALACFEDARVKNKNKSGCMPCTMKRRAKRYRMLSGIVCRS